MGPSKKFKRTKFVKRYKPSTEKYRLKMEGYANKVRMIKYIRKLDILSGKILVREYN